MGPLKLVILITDIGLISLGLIGLWTYAGTFLLSFLPRLARIAVR